MNTSLIVGPASAEPLTDAKQVAARIGVAYLTVLKWGRCGKIPCVKISPRAIRFRLSEVVKALGIRASESEVAA